MLNKEFLDKLNEYYAMDILKMLSSQKEDRKEILNNEKIREKLKRELLRAKKRLENDNKIYNFAFLF